MRRAPWWRIRSCRRFPGCLMVRWIVPRRKPATCWIIWKRWAGTVLLRLPRERRMPLAACNNCSDDEKRFAFAPAVLNANPARARRRGDSARLGPSNDLVRGQQIYVAYCATCHGARGDGDTPGAIGLRPRPVNLTEQDYTLDRLSFSLWNGVAGTAMPAWRELGVNDLSAVAQVVRDFHQAQAEPSIPAP